MKFLNALIALVCQTLYLWSESDLTVFEQAKVMNPTSGMCGTDDFVTQLVDNHLRFQSVPFLFSTIEALLFFFGRSIGLSVTSTTTTLISDSDPCSCFFPGRLKALDWLSAFSMLRTIR